MIEVDKDWTELLNRLMDENEQLKRENEKFSDSLKYHRNKVNELKAEVNGLHDINTKYEEEIKLWEERLRLAIKISKRKGEEIELLKERVKWLEDRECPQCGFVFDITEE